MFFRTDLAMEAEEFSGGGLEGVQKDATRHGDDDYPDHHIHTGGGETAG